MIASSLGSACRIASTAGGAFAAFYIFYTAAPVAIADAHLGAGVRAGIVMAAVVAVQPLVGRIGRWIATGRRQVTSAAISMGVGSAIMPFAGHWPSMLLLAVGFGIFVVASTAWIKETAPSGLLGRALGVYGFGSAIGGALGAPLGLILIGQFGIPGTAVVGSLVALASTLPALRVRTTVSSDVSPVKSAATQTAPRGSRLWSGSGLIGLGAHLLAVTIYAAALSGLASGQTGRGTWLPVNIWGFGIALFIAGTGIGVLITVASSTIITNVTPERAGMASSVEEVSYEFGSLLSVTVLGSPLTSLALTTSVAETGYQGVLCLEVTAAVLGLVSIAWLLRNERTTTSLLCGGRQ